MAMAPSTDTAHDHRNSSTPVYVPTAEIAEVLHCNPRTVCRLAERGLIPRPITVGGLTRWDLHRVLAALQAA
jgi:hypothetical protein